MHLDEPDHVVRVQLVLADPGGQDVPLDALAPVDGDAVLRVLVLAGLQVGQHLLRQLRQEPPMQQVVLPRRKPLAWAPFCFNSEMLCSACCPSMPSWLYTDCDNSSVSSHTYT